MQISEAVVRLLGWTRTLPTVVRYLVTIAIVGAMFGVRHFAAPWLPDGYPFLFFFIAILLSSALFDHGTGLLAVVLSALLSAYFLNTRTGSLRVDDPRELVAIGVFVGIGAAMAFVIESLHQAIAGQRAANAELGRSEHRRSLLLNEFRHRTRNDLGSLVALLHLRARAASSDQVRDGLREAAQHAMALARVHTQLSASDIDDGAVIDTRLFLTGLCDELVSANLGDGLRPVAMVAEAESHMLDSERAVQLGLVLNEALTNSLKYAFPDGRAGSIGIRFKQCEGSFVMTVTDDGIGLPPEGDMEPAPHGTLATGSGLGTRLLRALAAQLRGSFMRHPGPDGRGTMAELRFPVVQPGR